MHSILLVFYAQVWIEKRKLYKSIKVEDDRSTSFENNGAIFQLEDNSPENCIQLTVHNDGNYEETKKEMNESDIDEEEKDNANNITSKLFVCFILINDIDSKRWSV